MYYAPEDHQQKERKERTEHVNNKMPWINQTPPGGSVQHGLCWTELETNTGEVDILYKNGQRSHLHYVTEKNHKPSDLSQNSVQWDDTMVDRMVDFLLAITEALNYINTLDLRLRFYCLFWLYCS